MSDLIGAAKFQDAIGGEMGAGCMTEFETVILWGSFDGGAGRAVRLLF